MEHLLLKAATTVATDQGEFEAVISTATIDRERDIVDPEGFVRALQKWIPLGKKIPLDWNHATSPDLQIGYIDPATARVVDGEVVVAGFVDQSVSAGKDAWRLIKLGVMGFSFAYLTLKAAPRRGGGKHLQEFDVLAATASPTPMNNDTRVLSWKATMAPDGTMLDNTDDDAAETPLKAIADAIEELQEFVTGEQVEGDSADVQQAERLITNLQALMRTEMGQGDDGKALRKRADELALELAAEGVTAAEKPQPDMPAGADWLFPEPELKAARDGDLKAVWTTAYVNDLPDSSFLYVEGGGDKDSEGKTTPRSLRHFPYKDAGGAVDLPHLRNALARIPQSSLSQDVKDRLASRAQGILDEQKSVDATGKETQSRSVDPLRAKADALVLEFASDGESLRKPPQEKAAPKPSSGYTPEQIRDIEREYTLIALTGDTEP